MVLAGTDTDDESSESSSSSSDEIELTDLCPTAVAELMAGKPTATAKVHTIDDGVASEWRQAWSAELQLPRVYH